MLTLAWLMSSYKVFDILLCIKCSQCRLESLVVKGFVSLSGGQKGTHRLL